MTTRSHLLGYYDRMTTLGPAIRPKPEPTPEQMAAEIRRAAIAAFEARPVKVEAARELAKPVEDGWIAFAGGECPVDPETEVFFSFRFVGQVGQLFLTPLKASKLRWHHLGVGADIVAYRLVAQA